MIQAGNTDNRAERIENLEQRVKKVEERNQVFCRPEPEADNKKVWRDRNQIIEHRITELENRNRLFCRQEDEALKEAAIWAGLLSLGVIKVQLAYRAIRDDVFLGEDGQYLAHTLCGDIPLDLFLEQFVKENPEL